MAASADMLNVTSDGAVLRLILNRPERRNALHPEQLHELTSVISRVPDDVRLVTLEGAGDVAFSAGFDIKVLAAAGPGERPSETVFAATAALAACPAPTLAIVRGFCLGAGFDLAMACDFRVGTPDARFAVPAVRLATVYEPRSVDRIRRLLGPTVTKELFMLGREFDAARAFGVGILQELIEPDRMGDVTERWLAPNRAVTSAHKHMIDELEARHDRPQALWPELDALRDRSVAGSQRQDALGRFVGRSTGVPQT